MGMVSSKGSKKNYKISRKSRIRKKNLAQIRLRQFSIVVFLFVLGVCLLSLYKMVFLPRIVLEGESVVEVPYLGKYKEDGYLSSYQGKDITSKVKVKGKVNYKKIGEYTITYEVSYHGRKSSKTRVIKVVDNKKPKITFTGDNKKLYVCPNTKYLFDDYQAVDDYDGDITNKVKVDEEENRMRYEVKDSSGNKTVKYRKVFYKDIEGPKLTLDDSLTVMLVVGDEFKDSTYQVEDNCSSAKDIKVTISGKVDTSKAGEYERVYKAKDKYGNVTKVVQKISVMEPSKQGVIYLTFDDGPRSGTTDIILNVLKEKGVKATFFVTNSGPDDLIKRAYNEGHSIGLHTASHDYSVVYKSVDSYFNDLKAVSDRVYRITGEKSMLIRFPGGSSNTISKRYSAGIMSTLTKEVLNRGYRYYDWNVDSRDAEGGKFSADEIASFVTSNLSHDRVNMVLMHDIKVTTKDAIGKIIDYGKANGYRFEAITNYTDMVTQRVNN